MFCFQCQETAKGTGCVLKGVCGKSAFTARNMDLLLFVVRGIAVAADSLRQHNVDPGKETDTFVTDALFSTITNANFDDESIMRRIDRGLEMRDALKARAETEGIALPGADWNGPAHAPTTTPKPQQWACCARRTKTSARSKSL